MRAAYVAARSRPKVFARFDDFKLLGSDLETIWSVALELHRSNWIARALEHCDMTYAQAPMPIGGHPDSQKAFLEWWDYAGLRGENLDNLYAMIISGQTRVGDILGIFCSDPKAKTAVKARLALLDGMRVRTPDDLLGKVSPSGGQVIHGVEYNSDGVEVGYWVCKVADGTYQLGKRENFIYYPRVDAETGRPVARLLRRPDSLSPSSSRGLPSITHVVPQIEDLGDLEGSSVQAAHVKSLLSVMLETTDPMKVREAMSVQVDENGNAVRSDDNGVVGQIQSGDVVLAPPGTRPIPISHAGNSEIVALMAETLRHVSGALGRPLELLMSNFANINFSSSKNSFDKFARQLQMWIDSNSVFLTEVYQWVCLEAALARGVVPDDSMLSVTWSPVTVPDPDPGKSASAEQTRLSCGTETRTSVLAKRGIDYKTHLETIARERALEIEILGAELDIKVEPAAMSAEVPAEDKPAGV